MTTSPPTELSTTLARLEVKVDQLLTINSDHEGRIRKLEERRWPLQAVAVVMSGVALIASIVPPLIR